MGKGILTSIIVVVLSVLFFSFRAGDVGSQFTGDENFYFQSSKNMLETKDWLTPRYYGKPRFQKPILYYWLIAGSFKIFGINWYGARFPSILLAAFTVLLTYLIGKRLFKSEPLSLLSAFVLATTFKFFKYSRFAIPDMALLCFITLSFYILVKLLEEDKKSFLWMVFFFSLALTTMIKGPVGIIIPVLSIVSFRIFSKERIAVKKTDIVLGSLLYILVVVPWFLIMIKLHGEDFTSQIWIREITHRVGYHSDTKEGISVFVEYLGSLFFYIPILIIRFLPWSIFLPKGMLNSFSIAKSDAAQKRIHPLLLSWFFVVFIFFSFMGEKHSQYMLALSVPFALIVGTGFSSGLEFSKKRLIIPIFLVMMTAFSFVFFLSNEEFRLNNAIMGGFASEIISSGLDESDRVGMGSHGLIPQQLEVYLDRPVEKIGVKWYDPYENERINKLRLEDFFRQDSTGFCIISREDFKKYIPPKLEKRLRIIHKDFLWKRKIEFTKDKLALLSGGKVNLFFNSFKQEYYLVTNK